MITRISSRGGGAALCKYLKEDSKDNDKIEFGGAYGTIAQDPEGAFKEMDEIGKMAKGKNTLAHLVIRPERKYSLSMSEAEWLFAIRENMKAANLKDQPFAYFKHLKDGSWHAHVAVQRLDTKTGKFRSDSYNGYELNTARERIERALGHTPTPKYNEMKKEVNRLNFQAFMQNREAADYVSAMKEKGFTVAQNNTRDPFVLVHDDSGRTFSVAKNLKDRASKTYVAKKEVFKKLSGHDLPEDKEVIKGIRQEQRKQSIASRFDENDPTVDTGRLKKKHQNSTLPDMKEAGADLTNDKGDKHLTDVQGRMTKGVKEFKERRERQAGKISDMKEQGAEATQPKDRADRTGQPKETDKERIRQEMRERMLQNLSRDRGRDKEGGQEHEP